jgi:hypothetical protein
MTEEEHKEFDSQRLQKALQRISEILGEVDEIPIDLEKPLPTDEDEGDDR